MYVYLLSKRITLIYCANFLTCNICCKYLQHTYSSLAAPNGSVKCVISLALYLSIFIFKITHGASILSVVVSFYSCCHTWCMSHLYI